MPDLKQNAAQTKETLAPIVATSATEPAPSLNFEDMIPIDADALLSVCSSRGGSSLSLNIVNSDYYSP